MKFERSSCGRALTRHSRSSLKKSAEQACKPNSVPPDRERSSGDGHFSWPIGCPSAPAPYPRLKRGGPPRPNAAALSHGRIRLPLTWACWRWGLPCRDRHRPRGALLPHHFTLACDDVSRAPSIGGVFSVALSLASPPAAVSRHRALPSSDFPPGALRRRATARPALHHNHRRSPPRPHARRRQASLLSIDNQAQRPGTLPMTGQGCRAVADPFGGAAFARSPLHRGSSLRRFADSELRPSWSSGRCR